MKRAHDQFRQWYGFESAADNRLFERAYVTSEPIRRKINVHRVGQNSSSFPLSPAFPNNEEEMRRYNVGRRNSPIG
jgi:hypothetical protein